MQNLLEKYNIPAPRYTSYPTVPYWDQEAPTSQAWFTQMNAAFDRNNEISLYIHLPFCERLCTYCGCNKRITKNHQVESPYVDALLAEWKMYLEALPHRPVLKEVHLGGGTPTFFSPAQLEHLLGTIFQGAIIPENHSFSFEAHPSSTSKEHLATLYQLGFNRISIGVQDFDAEILRIINRFQTLEQVENVVEWSREIGYESINFDLIFGLPLQRPKHIKTTMRHVADLQPDRIAFYSYAHVPWVSPSQRAYSEADLPMGNQKRALYDLGKILLMGNGYHDIGLDHFAKADDELYEAFSNGTLHRNFMGYTPFSTELMIGLGASSISDAGTAYVQNEKKIETYQNGINAGQLPVLKGHLLTAEDVFYRQQITRLMCLHQTRWDAADFMLMEPVLLRLREMEADGLVEIQKQELKVTTIGEPFLRNISMAFDARLWERKPTTRLFSQVV